MDGMPGTSIDDGGGVRRRVVDGAVECRGVFGPRARSHDRRGVGRPHRADAETEVSSNRYARAAGGAGLRVWRIAHPGSRVLPVWQSVFFEPGPLRPLW